MRRKPPLPKIRCLLQRSLCRARPAAYGLADLDAGLAEQLDEHVHAKPIDPPAHQVADPWLRDAKEVSGLVLGYSQSVQALTELNHQVGPRLEIGCLIRRKSHVR